MNHMAKNGKAKTHKYTIGGLTYRVPAGYTPVLDPQSGDVYSVSMALSMNRDRNNGQGGRDISNIISQITSQGDKPLKPIGIPKGKQVYRDSAGTPIIGDKGLTLIEKGNGVYFLRPDEARVYKGLQSDGARENYLRQFGKLSPVSLGGELRGSSRARGYAVRNGEGGFRTARIIPRGKSLSQIGTSRSN